MKKALSTWVLVFFVACGKSASIQVTSKPPAPNNPAVDTQTKVPETSPPPSEGIPLESFSAPSHVQVTRISGAWQNPRNSTDVNNDGLVNTSDSDAISEYINSHMGDGTVSGPPNFGFVDVNGNGFVTSQDVLIVRNFLTSPPGTPGVPVKARVSFQDNTDDEDGFKVLLCETSGGSPSEELDVPAGTGKSVVTAVVTIKPSTRYYIQVRVYGKRLPGTSQEVTLP